jgi:hypothetical protein
MPLDGSSRSDQPAPDAWARSHKRAQSVVATWLNVPGVLDLVRATRSRVDAPGIEIEQLAGAIADVFGIELLLDELGQTALGPFRIPRIGDGLIAQASAQATVSEWLMQLDRLAGEILDILPSDAPFEATAAVLTLAELVLSNIDLDRPAARIAADLQIPPSHVRLDHRGGMEASWFADDRDRRLAGRLAKGLRPRTKRTVTYGGGRRRAMSSRSLRARLGFLAVLRESPDVTAKQFEGAWFGRSADARTRRLWTTFATAARCETTDGVYTQDGVARLLREVRRTLAPANR